MSGNKPGEQPTRRGFFRLGLERIRDGALDAAREFADAGSALADAVDGSEAEAARHGHEGDETSEERGRIRDMVRPPGALPEAEFLAHCERCHACVEACPDGSIFSAGLRQGYDVHKTPMLEPDQAPCYLCTDIPCISACPTGALRPIPWEEIRIGEAIILSNLCLNRRGEACDACLKVCPFPGEAIRAGEGGIPVVTPEHCTGCGQCAAACPAYPKAIAIRPR